MSYSDDDDYGLGCFVCGSTNFHYEEGQQYCENGHLLSQSQVIGADETDYQFQGRRNRAARQKTEKQRVAKVYRGKEAFELFLQAYQFILWKQCHDLINKKGFPPQFWTVVLDLWTLRLAKVAARLDEPEKQVPDVSTGHDTDESTDDRSDSETGQERSQGKKVKAKTNPLLRETVALCYLAMVVLRQPTPLKDLFSWIESGELTYVRAIRQVPKEMRERMMGNYQQDLDTLYLPTLEGIQSSAIHLARIYMQEFGITFPPLNVDPLLYRQIKDLALPLEAFPATMALGRLLGCTFTFSSLSGKKNQLLVVTYPEAQLISLLCVSVKLLFPFDSAITRCYPHTLTEPAMHVVDWDAWLTNQRSVTEKDPGSVTKASRSARPLLYTTDADVFGMTTEQLDKYMDWYQEAWAKPEIEAAAGSSKEILDMFPLSQAPQTPRHHQSDEAEDQEKEERKDARLKAVQEQSRIGRAMPAPGPDGSPDSDVLRPGERYHMTHWTVDDFAGINGLDLEGDRDTTSQKSGSNHTRSPEQLEKSFLYTVSKVSGINIEDLLRAIKHTERNLIKWLDDGRRTGYWEAVDETAEVDVQLEDQIE